MKMAADDFACAPPSRRVVLQIERANPKDELRKIGDSQLRMETIFNHLDRGGFSKHILEDMIPEIGAVPAPIGASLYGLPVYIGHHGRIMFDDSHLFTEEEDDDVMPDPEPQCQHTYVVRSREGDYKYLCKECNERYVRHPKAPDPAATLVVAQPKDVRTINELQRFREGLSTYSEVVRKTTLSLDEFKKAMTAAFPPMHTVQLSETMGVPGLVGHVVDTEPQRTSCPEQVEAVFGDINVNISDLMKITEKVFKDVTEVKHEYSQATRQMVITLHFVDSTKQRVTIDEMSWKGSVREFKAAIGHSYSPKTGGFGVTIPREGEGKPWE